MNKYLVASVLIMISPLAAFSQAIESAAASDVAKLKANYETALDELLGKYIKAGDLASVAAVASELKRFRPGFPKVEQGNALVGYWDWKNNNRVVLSSNGLALGNDDGFGIWKWIDEKEGKAEIKWSNGYIDTVRVSPDRQKLHIVNNMDMKFVADRIGARPQS